MSDFPFFSIGHGVKDINDFIKLLKSKNIRTLADIRSVPRSLKNPDYNKDTLPIKLKSHDIEYAYIAELGGFRGKSKSVSAITNMYWKQNSFKNYADYALSDQFKKGLDILLSLNKDGAVAFMCAEAVWWKCHRRIVTDYLLAANATVYHIIDSSNIKAAKISGAAVILRGQISYPDKDSPT